ncbi:MAG: efflux RND transporter periplasmic adaptor subunit [Myxococcota bacterium]|nr:efflux RND transporter periplasmic adaptor subunit [Myxococcota bacterium]
MIRLLCLLLLSILAVLPGCEQPAAEVSAELHTCGMHPQVVQEGPGSCPICGMDLTPMGAATAPMDAAVQISPGVIQQIGVETAPVEKTTVFRHIRTIGEVEVGEDELAVVNLRFSGWVERIQVDKTGDEVRTGQTLFEIYSPELVAAQEEYLLALRTQGPEAPLARSARRKLELWNLSSRDIDRIASSGIASRTMPIRAPQSGFVLHKNLVEGARVSEGQDLYRIGNLQRIWVTAEVYEHDAPWVEEGQPAQLEMTHLAGQVIEGVVSYIYPTMNPDSRTLTVRLEFDNPGVRLKPGMFATVHIQYRRQDDVLAVPLEAILHSGRRQLVFIALGQGRFEPREVTTGLTGDHRMIEVTGGLSAGEEVVTSAQFLIDSESQLQEALQKILASSKGAVSPKHSSDTLWSCPMHPEVLSESRDKCTECGMFLEERSGTPAEREAVYGPKGAQPGQYTCPMHPEVVSDEPGRCPDCSMFLEQVPEAVQDDHAPAAGRPG